MTEPARGPISVRGGAGARSAGGGTIRADLGAIRAMAARFGAAGSDTLGSAWSLHRFLGVPSLVASAALDPVGFAEFETDLLGALDGVGGLSWAGAEAGAIDAELRLAAEAYERSDQLGGAGHEIAVALLGLAPALYVGGKHLVATGDPARAAQAVLTADPELADLAVDALGVRYLATGYARIVPDGHGVLRHAGLDRRAVAGRPPRRLTDVLRDLVQRDADGRHGEIDVRVLTMADGSRRAIVDITGTKSWDPLPTHDVTSLTTNARAVIGERGAYEQGVCAAMQAAGVRPGDEVMIVGHSEGGLVAVTTARDALASGRFHVTHVVTTGSPIGHTVGELPDRVKVLALENTRDLIPHLDGVPNPDAANITTVSEARGDGTIAGDHSIGEVYVRLAADAQASDNASVREYLRSARGFFRATTVRTYTYQVQRAF